MKDHQNLERVRLTFDRFTVPRGRQCNGMANCPCTEGYLKVGFCQKIQCKQLRLMQYNFPLLNLIGAFLVSQNLQLKK